MDIRYIDSEEIYQEFLKDIENNDVILHYTGKNINHSANNEITVLACFIQRLDILYIVLLNHNEVLYDVSELSIIPQIYDLCNKIYVYDKKELLHYADLQSNDKIIDISLLYYFEYNQPLEVLDTNTIYSFYNEYADLSGVLTPSVKLIEHCQLYINAVYEQINKLDLSEIDTKEFNFYNNLVISNLSEIESTGLTVNSDEFNKHFSNRNDLISKDKLVYSEYNLYTSTGRPSNKFGGINFAALEKKDGTRECFVSRFTDGTLLEFDFDGYHLKLISKLMGYEIPEDLSIHEYLGRYYFDTDKLTPEQYKESKEISFKIIYGGHSKDFQEIPYFKNVYEYIEKMWKEFNKNDYIISPISKKKIKKSLEKTNKNKFFNYLIQLLETEYSMIVIKDLLYLIKVNDLKSKLILYTYDSFLFDCSPQDVNFIAILKKQLEKYGIGYKLKQGYNYQKMNLIS